MVRKIFHSLLFILEFLPSFETVLATQLHLIQESLDGMLDGRRRGGNGGEMDGSPGGGGGGGGAECSVVVERVRCHGGSLRVGKRHLT